MLNLKITTIIVENNPDELKKISSVFKNNNEFSLISTTTKIKSGISLITNYTPDLVLVNIELDEMSGIEFIKILHNRNIFPEIVFLAENINLAYDSLKVEPFDYLIKPIQKEDIEGMLDRLKTKLRKKELLRKMDIFTNSTIAPSKRIFEQKGGIVVLLLDEIVFCKAELTRTVLILKCGETIKLKTGINETLEIINSDNFIRIGRSYCINRNYLRKIDKKQYRCHLHSNGNTWEVPASKNTINQIEKLNISTMY